MARKLFLFCVLLFAFAAQLNAQPARPTGEPIQALTAADTRAPIDFAAAMDINPSQVASVTLTGASQSAAVFSNLGVIKPVRANSFAILSTGTAGSSYPDPGVDFYPYGTSGDTTTLSVKLNVPAGDYHVTFHYNFLNAEYPEYTGSIYNDTFQTTVVDASGTREIARATANGTSFSSGTSANAGGSGYVNQGVTGFRTATAPVKSSGQITVNFSIRDVGDGYLDSAVILDNFTVSAVETLDPNPDLVSNGAVITDAEQLASKGTPRWGAAADGVTRIVVRQTVSQPGNVEFCMASGNVAGDGGFALPGADGRAACVTSPVKWTSKGYKAFAIYRTPEDFNRGTDAHSGQRTVAFRTRFYPTSGGMVENTSNFELVRPPVVVIHGLWDSGSAWTSFPIVHDPRFSVVIADYEATHAYHFSQNAPVLPRYLTDSLKKLHVRGLAATQVDVAGHSMGGILTRNHVGSAGYKNSGNYYQGSVNKVVTMNTPHTGSPFGNIVQGIRSIPVVGWTAEQAFAVAGFHINQGAIEDLAEGSPAILSIPQTTAPSHAIIGVGGSELPNLSLAPCGLGELLNVFSFFTDAAIFGWGEQHDGIVSYDSQQGGIASSATTVYGGEGSIHICVTNPQYSNRLIELFNTSVTSPTFSTFPSPAVLPREMPMVASVIEPRNIYENTMAMSATGSAVEAGKSVNVTITPDSRVTSVLLIGDNLALLDDAAPFEFTVNVPADRLGAFTLNAIGKDANNDLYTSTPLTFDVFTSATLQSIQLMPDNLLITSLNSGYNVAALGVYSDGITRSLTSAAGTSFSVSSPFMTVSPDGVVSAAGWQGGTLTVSHGGLSTSMNVDVYHENQAPTAVVSSAKMAKVGDVVTLDGSGSYDLDAQFLSYEWQQVSGPETAVINASGATASFNASTAGEYVFSLVAHDGYTSSAPANVVVTVIDGLGNELIINGGFEIDADFNNRPDGWKTKVSRDKNRCNTSGNCAFFFRPSETENTRITQTIDVSALNLTAGTAFDFSALVNAKGSPRLKFKVRAFDANGVNVGSLNLNVKAGTSGAYQATQGSLSLNGNAATVKVIIQNRTKTGRIYVDDVSLKYR